MARGEDRGTWGGPDGGSRWPPSPRPRGRDEARADLDRRTDERDIDRRHAWRGADERREYEGPGTRRETYRGESSRDWPPSPRPRGRDEARADLDRRTDERDIDRRHAWRQAGGRGRESRMAPTRMARPRGRDELRADLDRRTDADEINRRHAWRGGGFQEEGGFEGRGGHGERGEGRGHEEYPEQALPRRGFAGPDWVEGNADLGPGPSRREEWGEGRRFERRGRGAGPRGAGRDWPPSPRPHGRDEARADLDRRTDERDIDRRHGWRDFGFRDTREGERGGRPRAEERFDERDYLEAEAAPEETESYGAGPGEWGERDVPYSGGYGGYGGGEYGGSYGGIGPGTTGTYPAAYTTGLAGGGSILGRAGGVAGWEETREMGPRSTASMLERAARRGWAREGPLVRDVMTRNPRSVGPDDTVVEAARAMREEDAGIIPVTVDNRVIGVVTDRDLAMRVLAEGRGLGAKVSEVMSEDVHVCTADDRLVDAVRVMGEENVRRLPVVDRDDRLLGILSMTDVAREAELDYALQEALEQLASRRSFWSRW